MAIEAPVFNFNVDEPQIDVGEVSWAAFDVRPVAGDKRKKPKLQVTSSPEPYRERVRRYLLKRRKFEFWLKIAAIGWGLSLFWWGLWKVI